MTFSSESSLAASWAQAIPGTDSETSAELTNNAARSGEAIFPKFIRSLPKRGQ
jgi:hypothetical protein